MRVVFKYPLINKGKAYEIQVPEGAWPCHYELIEATPVIWYEVETTRSLQTRKFILIGTGWNIPEGNWEHRVTFRMDLFIWHLYEDVSPT